MEIRTTIGPSILKITSHRFLWMLMKSMQSWKGSYDKNMINSSSLVDVLLRPCGIIRGALEAQRIGRLPCLTNHYLQNPAGDLASVCVALRLQYTLNAVFLYLLQYPLTESMVTAGHLRLSRSTNSPGFLGQAWEGEVESWRQN